MKETNQKNAIRTMVKTNNGITLIALVVTIVVLLILAGISISMVLGNNGLITKAKDAKTKTEQDQANTETAMNNLYDEMMGILGENGGSGNGDATSKVGTKFAETGTIDGGEAASKIQQYQKDILQSIQKMQNGMQKMARNIIMD